MNPTDSAKKTPVTVDFYFDPVCPWAWMTSRWLIAVTEVREVIVNWQMMSLAVLNDGKEVPVAYQEMIALAWGPVRVLHAAQAAQGSEVILPLYTAIGNRIHLENRLPDQQLLAEALAEVELPAELVEAAEDSTWDDQVRAMHHAGMDPVGDDVGTPVMHFGDVALFGPVVSPAPKGEAAGVLFDGVYACATTPGFFELKRSRNVGPIFE